MKVRFMRVLGVRSAAPQVLAYCDDLAVRWEPILGGWSCSCTSTARTCGHIETITELLDPRVLTHPRKRK